MAPTTLLWYVKLLIIVVVFMKHGNCQNVSSPKNVSEINIGGLRGGILGFETEKKKAVHGLYGKHRTSRNDNSENGNEPFLHGSHPNHNQINNQTTNLPCWHDRLRSLLAAFSNANQTENHKFEQTDHKSEEFHNPDLVTKSPAAKNYRRCLSSTDHPANKLRSLPSSLPNLRGTPSQQANQNYKETSLEVESTYHPMKLNYREASSGEKPISYRRVYKPETEELKGTSPPLNLSYRGLYQPAVRNYRRRGSSNPFRRAHQPPVQNFRQNLPVAYPVPYARAYPVPAGGCRRSSIPIVNPEPPIYEPPAPDCLRQIKPEGTANVSEADPPISDDYLGNPEGDLYPEDNNESDDAVFNETKKVAGKVVKKILKKIAEKLSDMQKGITKVIKDKSKDFMKLMESKGFFLNSKSKPRNLNKKNRKKMSGSKIGRYGGTSGRKGN